jgi:peroxiredoxin-like protein
MQDLPHHYTVRAVEYVDGDVELSAERLPRLISASPAEFGGPGDRWSPETLLVSAVADCLLLTFRAVARAMKLSWTSLTCDASGTLDRVERVTQFTAIDVRARLVVPADTDPAQARRALEKAEQNCLIANSLKAPVHLTVDVVVEAPLAAVVGA